jgi:hypothetical protein
MHFPFTGGRSTLPFSYSAIFCLAFSNFWLKHYESNVAFVTVISMPGCS